MRPVSPVRAPVPRLTRGAVVAFAVSAVLSGCAQLATDSPVRAGLKVGADQGESVRLLPPAPLPGSTPKEIVQGFIRGGAASDEAYDVARSYLSGAAAEQWRPDRSVVVFQSEAGLTVKAGAEGRVTVTVPVLATIDAAGRYTQAAARTTAVADFSVENSSGQWRISGLPKDFGLWLGSFDADALFRPYQVTYVSVSGRRLVPDIRWFTPGKGLVTRLARAQLDAVPAYLAGAVRTAVPSGTDLAVDAVPVEEALATVDLGPATLSSETVARQNLWAQFYITLSQVPGVERLSLRQQGAPLALPGVDGQVSSLSEIGFPRLSVRPTVSALVRAGTTLRATDPQQLGEDGQQPPVEQRDDLPVVGTGWTSLALSADGGEIAAISGSRNQMTRWRGTSQLFVPPIGTALTRPTYDGDGILWVGGRATTGEGGIWVVQAADSVENTAAEAPRRVAAPWLAERVVRSVRVSADGTRAAVISTEPDGTGARVDVAGIDRERGILPSALAEPLRVGPRLVDAVDLVWVGQTALAVLARPQAKGPMTPWVVSLGGPSQALTVVPDAVSITTVSGERGLVVTTSTGDVLIRAGNRWLDVNDGIDFLVPAT